MDILENKDILSTKSKDSIITLDKLQLLNAKNIFSNIWIAEDYNIKNILNLLTSTGTADSDIVVIYLFTDIVFNRIDRENTKIIVKTLKNIITITNKEESDLINYGIKNTKHKKKLYKRIVKAYFKPLNTLNGYKDRTDIPRSILKDSTGRDIIVELLEEFFKVNHSKQATDMELSMALESKLPQIIIHHFMKAAFYGDDETINAIKAIEFHIDGDFFKKITDYFIGALGSIYKAIVGQNEASRKLQESYMIEVIADLMEHDKTNLQNERSFYTNELLNTLVENSKLKETINELTAELVFYKDFFSNKLKDKRLLVIGNKKKEEEYRQVVRELDGEMDMLDSFEDFSKINKNILDNYDYIVLFTYYTNHSVSDKLDKYSDKTYYVNSSSKEEFKKVLLLL